jgi:hypothetical protein
MDYGWLGQHERPVEHAGALAIVQMGARPYSPLLGRFLSVDPVDGVITPQSPQAESDRAGGGDPRRLPVMRRHLLLGLSFVGG